MKTSNPFKTIRSAGVPLCCFETADPAATIAGIVKSMGERAKETPVVSWDIGRGLIGVNERGNVLASQLSPNGAVDTGNPAECLTKLAKESPQDVVVFFMNAHRFISNESVAQCVWNLRDVYKDIHGTLVLLAPQLTLPAELKHDVVIISEPLPDKDKLSEIFDEILSAGGLSADLVPSERRPRMIETMLGLSAFAAEQVLAMSLTKRGVDEDTLWERKRRMIEQTPGLTVWKGNTTFDAIGGLKNLKTYLTNILTSGKTPVGAIGFIDEIEKALSGSAGDTSGTSQDQLGTLLRVTQDLSIPGIILLGPPGTGKSEIAKAAGNVASAPTISIDLGAMKGSLVGESEGKIRAAMDVFAAVSQGKGLFIATCNKISSLPPELRRRFTLGTFFINLPEAEERAAIWPIWLDRYSLQDKVQYNGTVPKFDAYCDGWTGAEIRACCDVAYRTGLSLEEASKFIVPVAKSAPEAVEALRTMAHGRFISASHEGTYTNNKAMAQPASRKLEVN